MFTLDYYQHNAKEYIADTLAVDMRELYARFMRHLPQNAAVLDAGCGSGRDAQYFIQQGYCVTAMDPCEALAESAEKLIGQPVERVRFQDISWQECFDGIWACASLLHIPADELPEVFQLLFAALKTEGVIYASFKYGDRQRIKAGRLFTDMNEELLAQSIIDSGANQGKTEVKILETWRSSDVRPDRADEQWLNCLLKKS